MDKLSSSIILASGYLRARDAGRGFAHDHTYAANCGRIKYKRTKDAHDLAPKIKV